VSDFFAAQLDFCLSAGDKEEQLGLLSGKAGCTYKPSAGLPKGKNN